ncbi:hypothetical protein JCGZ_17740 [Jatropha curcas]|uniref:BURP domain-containing protein n=1 Tax=Jatropha curcas TaxID=180498 RepID=A0A067JRQ9_JATCU|nr:polygalacturonase 1 beta-like protein 1 [Jatropha curcas]KDP26582.1 hypothetical protein JCGZ_17740 [Jatropha curcas]
MKTPLAAAVFLLFSSFFLSFSNVNSVSADNDFSSTNQKQKQNPFTPKASLTRYWSNQITTKLPISPFILSKASPLDALTSVSFSKLASQNALSTHLPAFCSAAKLFCYPHSSPSLQEQRKDSDFATYQNQNFTNYGTGQVGLAASFKEYSESENEANDAFLRYSRSAEDNKEKFSEYAHAANLAVGNFKTYGTGATGGSGDFKSYHNGVNFENLEFTSYGDRSKGRANTFTSYVNSTNLGVEWFTSYGKNGNKANNEFVKYDEGVNLHDSNFTNYGESGIRSNESFKSYGFNGNEARNYFTSYGDRGESGIERFTSYGEKASIGQEAFKSYGKKSNGEKIDFASYGEFNRDNFTGYGEGAEGNSIGFKIYGEGETNFKSYAKKDVTFAKYNVSTTNEHNLVKKWVEPGKFFRESMLKKGSVMPMPDIRDKMPKRAFLPRWIVSKLPFSTDQISQLKQIFNAGDGSSMETIILDAIKECERAPSPGETKRCVGSAEDLIDFATSVLGRNAVVWTTENVSGSKKDVMIGTVKGMNGGKVTKSVSCHQSLYPYLLYYCHSVPKVRVYEADILDPNSKEKINHGVAICHLDTSSWSPTHGAFLALGSGPGQIEVCHWIFENDMTWTIAD